MMCVHYRHSSVTHPLGGWNMIKLIAVVLSTILLSGCGSFKIVKQGAILKEEKTIEVPATGFSILDIKSELINDGWKIKVANENVQRVRLDATNPQIDSTNNFDAAYRLVISETVRNSQWVIGISISVIENKTNEEVLSMYCDSKGFGGCLPSVTAKNIVKELRSLEK